MKTSEEKLIDEFMNVRWDITLENAKEFVDIAEDFATDFAKWCAKYKELNSNLLSKYDDVFLIEELLEIYKKEKEL
jgi:ribosome biogenesis protein Tsr3